MSTENFIVTHSYWVFLPMRKLSGVHFAILIMIVSVVELFYPIISLIY
jgi:hypothetical protein